ncbi:hypothetical protein AY599_13495 [Leptolyngbya valderiana BDU 20041]|nr:hypothetical protein AY599_13495 [Leptolyngbya valderiana BDU 20041]
MMNKPLLRILTSLSLLLVSSVGAAQIQEQCVLHIDRFEDLTDRPVVQVVFDQVFRVEQTFEFDIDTVSPPDQSGLIFALNSAPAGMVINATTGQVRWDPGPLQVGVFSATVIVEDAQGLRNRHTFCIEVIDDSAAPLITPIGDTTVLVDQITSLSVEATDPDPEDSVSFSLDQAPPGMTIDAQNGLLEWTPSLADLGPNGVVIRAADDRGQFDLEAFVLTVVEANAAPMIDPIADRGARPGVDVAIQVTATDPDDAVLSYRLLESPSGMQIGADNGLIYWVPVDQQLGAQSVTVEVLDPKGFSDQASFEIVVDYNRAPVAVDDGIYVVERGDTLTVPAPGVLDNDEDPNDDPLTAQLVTGPERGSLMLNSDGSFDYTPDNPTGTIGFIPALEFMTPSTNQGPLAPPLVADVNDDGRADVVSQVSNGVAGRNVLLISSPDTGELIATSPPLDRGVINGSGKALADIDLDGYVEIISIGGENSTLPPDMNKVFAFEHDGTFKWESEQLAERYYIDGNRSFEGDGSLAGAEPTVADLDQDGTPEIIVGHGLNADGTFQDGVAVTVFDNQGMKLFTSYARDIERGGTFMRTEVVDLDLDGDPEILVGSAAFSHTGDLLWKLDGLRNVTRRATPLAANLDDDPFPELVRGGANIEQTIALNHDGTPLWEADTVFNFATSEVELTIADVDGDGLTEVLVVGNNGSSPGKLEVLNGSDGTLKWEYPSDGSGLNLGSVSPTVFDLDRDGNTEVLLFGSQSRTLWVLAGDTGQLIQEFDLGISNPPTFETPIFADVDNDGASELLLNGTFRFGPSSTYWVFESPNDDWGPTRSIWNQWNYHVTNVNPDGTIPRFEQPHWLLSGLNQNRIAGRLPEERSEESDSFQYAASDGDLVSSAARVDITVLPPNAAPRIVSTPLRLASPGFEYVYPVRAVDADPGETLTLSIAQGPTGMTLDALNQVIWTPDTGDLGPHLIVIDVVDSLGTRASQNYLLEVVPPVIVPDLAGLSEAQALADLDAVTLQARPLQPVFSDTVPAGLVAFQLPASGTSVAAGSDVRVDVSRGPIPISVPRVLGLTEANALDSLAQAGLNPGTVTWVNDPLIPRGVVALQDPPPNAPVPPGSPVDLTLSGGPRASLVVDPPVITAGGSATVSVEVRDVDGTPLDPQPLVDLSLVFDPGTNFGTPPSLVGSSIVTAPDTQGGFELIASYSVRGGESISTPVAVLAPISDGPNGDLYSNFARQLEEFGVLAAELEAAIIANDLPAIATLDQALADLEAAIDLRRLRTMTVIAPEGGVPPTPAQAIDGGLPVSAQDDAYSEASLDLLALLETLDQVMREGTAPDAVINQLNQELLATASALDALEPSVPGVLEASGAIIAITGTFTPRLVVADIQAIRRELADAGLTGKNVVNSPRFTLLGLMSATRIRNNILKDFYLPYVVDVATSMGSIIAADLLQGFVNDSQAVGIITGSSLAIHVFEIPNSVIEGFGFDSTLSPNNSVTMIGPSLLDAAQSAATGLPDASDFKQANTAMDAIQGVLDDANALEQAWNDANSIPKGVATGCILDLTPGCGQLRFPDGFTSVYSSDGGLSLPASVLIITRNLKSGGSAVFVANFVPTQAED